MDAQAATRLAATSRLSGQTFGKPFFLRVLGFDVRRWDGTAWHQLRNHDDPERVDTCCCWFRARWPFRTHLNLGMFNIWPPRILGKPIQKDLSSAPPVLVLAGGFGLG